MICCLAQSRPRMPTWSAGLQRCTGSTHSLGVSSRDAAYALRALLAGVRAYLRLRVFLLACVCILPGKCRTFIGPGARIWRPERCSGWTSVIGDACGCHLSSSAQKITSTTPSALSMPGVLIVAVPRWSTAISRWYETGRLIPRVHLHSRWYFPLWVPSAMMPFLPRGERQSREISHCCEPYL